jgi:hypothetical protein|tara:strand:+ start:253 stop:966 length:714 start_codon:yes stop_codon:yes gene_type:complete
MITVFNGKSFGLSGGKASGFVQIDRLLVDHITEFTPSGFVVFMVIVMHVDNEGYCWPSIKRLTECTGLSEATVRTALHYLTGMKINGKRLLEINARVSANGRTTSNGYKLFPDSIDHDPDVKVTSVKQERKEIAKEDDPAYGLYSAFKYARWGLAFESPVSEREWKDVRLTIWQMHKAGVTSEDVQIRTKVLLSKWKNAEMVTVRSLWKHWGTYALPQVLINGLPTSIEEWFNDNDG